MIAGASRMHRYPDGGTCALRRKIARKLGIKTDEILPSNGSNEVIELLGHVFLEKGKGIVTSDRAFAVYALVAKSFQADIVSVPMKDFRHDLKAMLSAIKPETRVVFVDNPNNPTSTMLNEAELDSFIEKVPDHVVVCIDEAYIELVDKKLQPDTLKHVRAGRKVVILRTFSKTYGLASLRLGYAVAPSGCIALMDRVRQPFNVNGMAQIAAMAALDDDEYVERTREMVKSGLLFFRETFEKMGLETIPAEANFMLVKVGNGRDVFNRMMKKGVIVRAMDVYGLPNHIRVSVGTPSENMKCVEALGAVMAENRADAK